MRDDASLTVVQVPATGDNPYQALLGRALRELGVTVRDVDFNEIHGLFPIRREWVADADVLHVHWPYGFYNQRAFWKAALRVGLLAASLGWLKLRGVRLVWTVHNRKSHDFPHPRLDAAAHWLLAKISDAVLTHCEAAKAWACAQWRIPPARVRVSPHGSFVGFYPDTVTREQARIELSLPAEARVFLFFGSLRANKGLSSLIAAFARLSAPDCLLVVAGYLREPAFEKFLRAAAARDPRVRLFLEFVPDERIQYFLRAADVVVMPYQEILTSSVVMLAKCFGRAVAAPALGCLPEQLGPGGGLLYDPEDPAGLDKALSALLTADLEALGQANRQGAENPSWRSVAEALRDLYLELGGKSGGKRAGRENPP